MQRIICKELYSIIRAKSNWKIVHNPSCVDPSLLSPGDKKRPHLHRTRDSGGCPFPEKISNVLSALPLLVHHLLSGGWRDMKDKKNVTPFQERVYEAIRCPDIRAAQRLLQRVLRLAKRSLLNFLSDLIFSADVTESALMIL